MTQEKFDVFNVIKYTTKNGRVLYPTSYTTIDNDPAAFIGSKSTIKTFGIFPKEMSNKDIREQLCKEQENNDKIIEEEEDYEDLVIPKIRKN